MVKDERYRRRRELGLCGHNGCDEKSLEGSAFCDRHKKHRHKLIIDRENIRKEACKGLNYIPSSMWNAKERFRQRHRDRGLCVECCSPVAPWRVRCEKHLKINREIKKRAARKRKENNLCETCGFPSFGYTYCGICSPMRSHNGLMCQKGTINSIKHRLRKEGVL